MEKSKKVKEGQHRLKAAHRVKKVYICPTCKGNGFVKSNNIFDGEITIHQCWDCDSEGELYDYEERKLH